MSDGIAFQEHWAAHIARRMAARIEHALATPDPRERRDALAGALDLGKEARLRIESGTTDDAAEREGLRHLQQALDEVQAALNRYDVCTDDVIRAAKEEAAQAADHLAAVGR